MMRIGKQEEFMIRFGPSSENNDFYGNKNNAPKGEYYFDVIVFNKSICSYKKDGVEQKYYCDIELIKNWFLDNKEYIYNELNFPLPVKAQTGLEFYNKSGNFDSDDDDEFYKWHATRQDWYFRHSWYSVNNGTFLADVLFNRVGNYIEITWDNTELFTGIEFINPKGHALVKFELFRKTIEEFLSY